MTEREKSSFTAKAAIGIGGGKTLFPPVELFFPDVSVKVEEEK